MIAKILVFDSHPVQYRVPVWQAMEAICPGCIHVAYASDCSVRGHADEGFGRIVAWDQPMLAGYENSILDAESGVPLTGWASLTGKGIKKTIERINPDVILLTGLNYKYDAIAYLYGRKKGIPVWLRCENQDEALYRTKIKDKIRSLVYRTVYIGISHFFYIGELNKQHYLSHGVKLQKLTPARYCTADRFRDLTTAEKIDARSVARSAAGISQGSFVVGFSGKFINKKNPQILFEMLKHMPMASRETIHLYFVGGGPMEKELKQLSAEIHDKFNINTFFAGFVNQSQLTPHYLAMDVLILPSRRMGETWGLVVNEAMQAGCAAIVSDAAGCGRDFKNWERFRIFKGGDPKALAAFVEELADFPRDFNWATNKLEAYSVEATAHAFVERLNLTKNFKSFEY